MNFIFLFLTYTKKQVIDNTVGIELGINNDIITNNRQKYKKKEFLIWIYRIAIYLLIFLTIPFTIYLSIKEKSFLPVGLIVYKLIIIIYFILGIYYSYKKDYTFLIYEKTNSMLFYILTSICVILSIINFIFIYADVNIYPYTEFIDIFPKTKIIMAFIIFFDSLYSYEILLTNLIIFIFDMFYVYNEMRGLYSKLINKYYKDLSENFDFKDIKEEYLEIIKKYEKNIKDLGYFFSTIVILGCVYLFFVLLKFEEKYLSSTEYIYSIIFVIFFMIFIFVIRKLFNKRQQINDIINDICDVKQMNIIRSETDNDNKDILNNIIGINSYLQINLIKLDISSPLKNFKIFGFEITDSVLIEKLIGIIILLGISMEFISVIKFF